MKKLIHYYKTKISPQITPKLIISIAIAWFLIAGWSLMAIAAGYILTIDWLFTLGVTWQTFLWLPIVIDSPLIIGLGILLHNIIFKKR
jgi:hypothetical protein